MVRDFGAGRVFAFLDATDNATPIGHDKYVSTIEFRVSRP